MGMEKGLAGHTATGNHHCLWGVMLGRVKGYGGSSLPLSLHITSAHFSGEYVHTLFAQFFLKQHDNPKREKQGRTTVLTRSFLH